MNHTNVLIGSNGDLGRQLAARFAQHGVVVRAYSEQPPADELTDNTVIHLCIPASQLHHYAFLDTVRTTVFVHDSVMRTSQNAIERYLPHVGVAVHMLMNQTDSVVIDASSPHADDAQAHLDQLGFNSQRLSIDEHDLIMAQSQAPLALLCQVVHTPLRDYRKRGLLTPSGEDLERALDGRAASWTPATIDSLLKNPQLRELVAAMQKTLDEVGYNKDND